MHSYILALAAIAGLVSALPQPAPEPTGPTAADIYTPSDVNDAFPLAKRGYDNECVECPPTPPECGCENRWKGCLYVECGKCDKDYDCCECLGLNKDTPYV